MCSCSGLNVRHLVRAAQRDIFLAIFMLPASLSSLLFLINPSALYSNWISSWYHNIATLPSSAPVTAMRKVSWARLRRNFKSPSSSLQSNPERPFLNFCSAVNPLLHSSLQSNGHALRFFYQNLNSARKKEPTVRWFPHRVLPPPSFIAHKTAARTNLNRLGDCCVVIWRTAWRGCACFVSKSFEREVREAKESQNFILKAPVHSNNGIIPSMKVRGLMVDGHVSNPLKAQEINMWEVCWKHSPERWQKKEKYYVFTPHKVHGWDPYNKRRRHIASSYDQDPGKTVLWWTLIQKCDTTRACDLVGLSGGQRGM